MRVVRTFGMGTLYVLIASVALAWTTAGCNSSGNCKRGDLCECWDGYDCLLGCEGDGCNTYCHNVETACGTVCDDQCTTRCDSTKTCTTSCGANCHGTCQSTERCGIICGPGCDYDCRSTKDCGVHAGTGSIIRCSSVERCEAVCDGPCQLICESVSRCELACPPNAPLNNCGGGRKTCGPC